MDECSRQYGQYGTAVQILYLLGLDYVYWAIKTMDVGLIHLYGSVLTDSYISLYIKFQFQMINRLCGLVEVMIPQMQKWLIRLHNQILK